MTWGLWFSLPQKEGVLRIYITLKNPLPCPGLNLRTVNPMAHTLTITLPRQRSHRMLVLCQEGY
jgi:hypothetical protein